MRAHLLLLFVLLWLPASAKVASVNARFRWLHNRASSALLLMLSVVNKAVAKADANAIRAGGSLLGLIGKYLSLLLAEVFVGRKVLVGLAVGFGCAAAFFGAKAVVCSE